MRDERIKKTENFVEDSSNRSNQGDLLNFAIRENAINALHSYTIDEADWLEGTQVYGFPTKDMSPTEEAHFSRIVADLRLIEWNLIWLRNRMLERKLTGTELSDEDYKSDRRRTAGEILLMDE